MIISKVVTANLKRRTERQERELLSSKKQKVETITINETEQQNGMNLDIDENEKGNNKGDEYEPDNYK